MVVAHTFLLGTLKVEANRSPGSGLQSKFQDSQGYTKKPDEYFWDKIGNSV